MGDHHTGRQLVGNRHGIFYRRAEYHVGRAFHNADGCRTVRCGITEHCFTRRDGRDGRRGTRGVGRVPLTLVSDVAYPLTTFSVTLVAAPVGAAPAFTSALGFQADPSLPPPRIDTSGGFGTMKLTWTLMHPAPTGTFKLGELLVPIPATATLGQSYTAQSTGGSSVYTIPDTPAQAGGTYTDTFIAGAAATVAVSNPVPLAVWISPNSAAPGSAATSAVVYGEGFTSASTVLWNGSPRTPTLLSESQLQFTTTSADLAAAGTAQVSVST